MKGLPEQIGDRDGFIIEYLDAKTNKRGLNDDNVVKLCDTD